MDKEAQDKAPPTDPEATKRRRAAGVAGHIGDENGARALITDGAATVRATAFGALSRSGRITEDDVRRGLADDEPLVRRRSCALAIPFAAVDLVPLLADPETSVVEQCAWALGERGEGCGSNVVASLIAVATEHHDPLCRESAVAALGAIGDEAGLPAILKATTDKPAIRRRAVIALAPFDGPAVTEALERAKNDRDWQVRQAAEDLTDGP